jgi:hypothetical protein
MDDVKIAVVKTGPDLMEEMKGMTLDEVKDIARRLQVSLNYSSELINHFRLKCKGLVN